ncbi:hypothetical protein ACIRPU_41115 [Streptomyces sp. NPDC102259]|uniref:hypothetical protein n=1 Tax=Streptomyces sp. NPDC102259 TaxID=3366148 RepID=UPI0038177CA0
MAPPSPTAAPHLEPDHRYDPRPPAERIGLPDELIALQQAADRERSQLERLSDNEERQHQRAVWFESAATAQEAITQHALRNRFNRHEVEQEVRPIARTPRG